MKLLNTARTALGLLCLLNSPALLADNSAEGILPCVNLTAFYGQIAAESEDWQQSQLDSLSDPVDACEELKLGLLLSHPVVTFQNDAKALNALSHALLLLPDHAVDKATLSMLMDHIEERQTLRNMLGENARELKKSQRRLTQRQRHIDTLRGQIEQLKNLEAQLEDKARAAIEPDTELEPTLDTQSEPETPPPAAQPTEAAAPANPTEPEEAATKE